MERFSIQRVHNAFDKKGFTLVEVIVVLVILAILAAMLVPKLTGWIDEAKGKTVSGEAHLVLSAAQAYASELYSQDGVGTTTLPGKSAEEQTDMENAIGNYLKDDVNISGVTNLEIADGQVTSFDYKGKNDKDLTYSSTDGFDFE